MADRPIIDLYRLAFGQVGTPYPKNNPSPKVGVETYDGPKIVTSDYDQKSLLGTPIFQPVTLDDYLLPNEPIVEVRGAKRVVRTDIDGMDGTFKELFSMDDYGVTIRGIITQEDGTDNFPEEIVRKIRAIYEKKTAIKITNTMANIFGINLIAIDSIEWPVIEGSNSIQPFVIQGIADKNLDIELRNG